MCTGRWRGRHLAKLVLQRRMHAMRRCVISRTEDTFSGVRIFVLMTNSGGASRNNPLVHRIPCVLHSPYCQGSSNMLSTRREATARKPKYQDKRSANTVPGVGTACISRSATCPIALTLPKLFFPTSLRSCADRLDDSFEASPLKAGHAGHVRV